jgi:2-polyprenyl-6-methoxyphenol hydroxylase-like FAD-dependent oxidoreductase
MTGKAIWELTGSEMRVVVVGAGLDGLCVAHGLHKAGVDVEVLEARDGIHDAGQGYRIDINATGHDALRRVASIAAAWRTHRRRNGSGALRLRPAGEDSDRTSARRKAIPIPTGASVRSESNNRVHEY